MSLVFFHPVPTFSQTTTYLPVTVCGFWPLVLPVKVPMSRAALAPSGLTDGDLDVAQARHGTLQICLWAKFEFGRTTRGDRLIEM
jgi:hypothetical protein